MAIKHLVDESNIVRYCRPTLIHRDGTVDGDAFRLHPIETNLSVHWLECFKGLAKNQRLDQVRSVSRLRMSRNGRGRLLELRVGRDKEHVRPVVADLSVVHSPLPAVSNHPADPAHSELRGLPPPGTLEAELAGDVIARCIDQIHPAVR